MGRDYKAEIKEASDYILNKYPIAKKCKVAIVLGSGWGPFVE